jgi:hyperosmotically inducible protein
MNTSLPTISLRSTVTAIGFAIAFAGSVTLASNVMSAATDADSTAPVAHSDGVVAAISDTAITAKIKSKLMGKEILKHSDVDVTTTNGVVTLTGLASTSAAKSFAGEEAKSVEGVKSVDNSLRVAGSSNAAAKTKRVVSDSWITTKVKSEILADSLVRGFDVNVKTKHGVVILKGTLASHDAVDHVKDIAAKVDGVKSVNITGLAVAKS